MKKDIKAKITTFDTTIELPYILHNKKEVIYNSEKARIILKKSYIHNETVERYISKEFPLSLINKARRTFYKPSVIINIFNYPLSHEVVNEKPNKIIKNNKIEKEWRSLHNYILKIYSNFIKSLYILKRNRKLLYVNGDRHNDLTKKLESLKIQIKHQNVWTPFLTFRTDLDFKLEKLETTSVKLENNDLDKLESYNLVNPDWKLYWEYIFLAEEHFKNDNYRMAIIELDIALEVVLKEYLQQKYSIENDIFDKLTKDVSTGDLLKCARFVLPNNKDYQESLKVLNKLHNTRNTILHRYQRNISKKHIKLFDDAIESIIILVDSLSRYDIN